ncbi:PulJ/GspJ family protein, partial [Synechococcus sp. BA-132 BA5]|uniref:PulJ/GspJ family protein n=1 Tax=Synechococcus sp. BA-132 BA5 TaxID=3110252 RepID=UPI002B3E5533|nr:hypothetical protein [Synechococcus sp. BA-132 BA5]
MTLTRSRTITATGAAGLSLVELLVAACLGLLVWGVALQAVVADGRQVDRLVRQLREKGQQQRVLALLRGDLLRAQRVDLAQATGAACGLGAGDRAGSYTQLALAAEPHWEDSGGVRAMK